MEIDEAIKHCEEVAKKMYYESRNILLKNDVIKKKECEKCANEHRQLADWLKELKESRMVLDILGQFLADMGTDICCEDLIMEDDYCEKYCENQKPLCWYRWAKMKAKEINADES